MGRLRARTDYVNIRTTRLLENQEAQLASLGVQTISSGIRSLASSAKSERTLVKVTRKLDKSPAILRRSARLEGKSYNFSPNTREKNAATSSEKRQQLCEEEDIGQSADEDINQHCKVPPEDDDIKEENDYESLRRMRISENQARLASLGIQKTISELQSITSLRKQERSPKKWVKHDYDPATLRRSDRLKGMSCDQLLSLQDASGDFEEGVARSKKRLKYSARFSEGKVLEPRLSPEAMARRCESKGRGSLYDGFYGICCHFCRQKKLCGEEDCKHCGNLDINEACIGKTECHVCHSSNGVFCRACLKVRYGEEMDVVRENKQWMCPHCVEEKGVRPYWICNSSFCLKKRKMIPTGIAIFKAKQMGYESVAHLLMDKLRRAEN